MGATSVVAWKGSAPSRVALLWALERERSLSGGMLLLTVIDEAFQSCGPAAMDELRVAARQALDAEVAWIRQAAPDVAVTGTVLEGDPEREILGSCPPGSMLIVGQREADSHVQRWSLAARLASQAPVPVAIIRAGPTRDRTAVIVGADGSQASLEASLVAAEEADRRHEPLHVVHAWPGPGPGTASDAGEGGPLLADHLFADHRQILDETVTAIREAFPSLTVEAHLEPGPASSVLLRHAQTAALLVVGSRAQGPVKRFLLGSVSRALALTTDCPLVIVAEGNRAEPSLRGGDS